jgi:hypothetical protein
LVENDDVVIGYQLPKSFDEASHNFLLYKLLLFTISQWFPPSLHCLVGMRSADYFVNAPIKPEPLEHAPQTEVTKAG